MPSIGHIKQFCFDAKQYLRSISHHNLELFFCQPILFSPSDDNDTPTEHLPIERGLICGIYLSFSSMKEINLASASDLISPMALLIMINRSFNLPALSTL